MFAAADVEVRRAEARILIEPGFRSWGFTVDSLPVNESPPMAPSVQQVVWHRKIWFPCGASAHVLRKGTGNG